MRNNLPVTTVEKEFPAGEFIVSKTNLKGLITYVNRTFIEISGFVEAELIGQPHNLVRHPDVPPDAFEDLWQTLKKGMPWGGLVKNRCKNGDFYWVFANVTPIRENGQVTGYLSVRTKPTREQINAAENLYREMREGRANVRIVGGEVVAKGLVGAVKHAWGGITIRTRLSAVVAFLSLALLCVGGAGIVGLQDSSDAMKRIHEQRTVSAATAGAPQAQEAGLVAREYQASQARYQQVRSFVSWFIVLCILLAGFAAVMLYRAVTRPLRAATAACDRIAQGDYSVQIQTDKRDEFGQLLDSMRSMQIASGFSQAEMQKTARENLRVRNALDRVSSCVMIADVDGHVIYMNHAVQQMLRDGEADLRKELPNFHADAVLGSNIDLFHKNPAHQRGILSTLAQPIRTTVRIGGRTYFLTAVPVINDQKERLGTAVEWVDRTAEVAVEGEVSSIVDAANDGDFTRRLSLQGKEGFFKQLAVGINGLMETSSVGLTDIARVLEALAKGDLTEKLTKDYKGTFGQLKNDTNTVVDKLTEIVGSIKESTESVNVASKEIASGNTDLSSRTEQQASSLEKTASSMEELTGTVKQNAENAKQANQLAASASSIAVKGGSVVSEVVTTMSSINKSSKKIVDIISVIDGIAFQTNILALNAAVEAARAGEQGRGFAVVATEVRTLAQRSAAAAKEIKELIGDSVEKVGAGTKLVDEAGQTMQEIVTSVKRVSDIMAEITAASQEQSVGIEQVNTAIAQMDEVTQQNSALVEEAAAAAESLEEQAENLAASVAIFKLSQEGSHAVVAVKPAATARHKPPAVLRPPAPKVRVVGAASSKTASGDWEEF